MDDRADRNPSEAKLRDGDGFGEKAFSRYVSFARKAFTACALAPPPPPGPGRRAGDTPESFARFAGDPPGVLDAEVRADDRAEKNAGLSCFGGLAWNAAARSEKATKAPASSPRNPPNASAVSRATIFDQTFPSLCRNRAAFAAFAPPARAARKIHVTRARAAAATSGPTVAASCASRISRRSAAETVCVCVSGVICLFSSFALTDKPCDETVLPKTTCPALIVSRYLRSRRRIGRISCTNARHPAWHVASLRIADAPSFTCVSSRAFLRRAISPRYRRNRNDNRWCFARRVCNWAKTASAAFSRHRATLRLARFADAKTITSSSTLVR
mmetsp:Transcript_4836/g.19329  ORF Transcript_4836/g.19329 Transcript_4836/m.19329 type:complete len:329 (-) Transcript_4836:1565-2551(-)